MQIVARAEFRLICYLLKSNICTFPISKNNRYQVPLSWLKTDLNPTPRSALSVHSPRHTCMHSSRNRDTCIMYVFMEIKLLHFSHFQNNRYQISLSQLKTDLNNESFTLIYGSTFYIYSPVLFKSSHSRKRRHRRHLYFPVYQ